MKYFGMPLGMWLLMSRDFRRELVKTLNFSAEEADLIIRSAKPEYRKIINKLPEFEKGDIFKTNIISCAMLSAIILNMQKKPTVEAMTEYYSKAMMTAPIRFYFRLMGKSKFSESDIANMQRTAALKSAERNQYSWLMEYLPYADGSGYECRFSHCGICVLMKELGIYEFTPAMCHLDYDMSEAGNADIFVRKYTLASGGPYCDCGYNRK